MRLAWPLLKEAFLVSIPFMNQIFKYQEKVQLYHVDAASMLFYGQLFFILHNAFAAFLQKEGFSIRDRLINKDFFIPVVHASANYSKPLSVGDEIEIDLSVEKIGASSFTVFFDLFSKGESIGDARIIHAAIDTKQQTKIELPAEFRQAIEKYIKKKSLLFKG